MLKNQLKYDITLITNKLDDADFLSSNSRCVDLSYLNRLTKSNPVLMMEMITLYLNQTPKLVVAMNKNLDEVNWNSLYSTVHQMIPSFRIMGISSEFENIARKIQEYAGIQQQSATVSALVLQLANVCTQSCIELNEAYNVIKSSQL